MSRLRFNWAAAVAHLRSQSPPLAGFIDEFRPPRLRLRQEPDLFCALARAICYQQLSGKAAATIHGRFRRLFPDDQPDPRLAARMTLEQLRTSGLSRAKSLSIMDLAEKTVAGELPVGRRLGRMGDAEVIETLCTVRGIGPWTAQMYLIFDLGRPDVMPATDLGVQKGVRAVYGLNELPEPGRVNELTAHLAPYRSAASWYFWRASENVL
jgi:3-methyladenine DNA glycosylase/8-oxoguanine DNA glycosylase